MHNGQIEHALLDECSTDTYVDQGLADELGLDGPLSSLDVGVLGGQTTSINTRRVNLNIRSVSNSNSFQIGAFTVRNVTDDLTMIDWNKYAKNWPHLSGVEFPTLSKNPKVRLLIGLNCPELHRSITEIYGRPGEPCARLTPLGWTCIGPFEPSERSTVGTTHFARSFFVQDNRDTDQLIRQMWELETEGLTSPGNEILSPIDDKVNNFARSTISFENGRYSIGIPWKQGEPKLSNNYDMAKSRLLTLEKSLTRRPEVRDMYCNIINDHLDKSYVREVFPQEMHASNIWYLPHFPVVKLDKSSTKVRLVMDAAARYKDKSLNDCTFSGPKLHRELLDVLIRFRHGIVAIAADVTEFFLQVEMLKSDKRFHRFLWRDMDIGSHIREFEYQRLVFGNTSSPFLSQAVIRQHATSHSVNYPLGANSVLNSMYVDDLLDSVHSVTAAIELRHKVTDLLASAGFQIRKWLSNDPRVLEDIPTTDRISSFSFQDGNLPSVKTLGILWDANTDNFKFKVESPPRTVLTKRFVVSKTASLFDPLNLLAPFTIRAKIGIQSSWLRGVDWDQELPMDLIEPWTKWFRELPELQHILVQRCLVDNKSELVNESLHTFVDASEKAYAAACYLLCEYVDKSVSVNFIASKTRVAPLKTISIPKLELCAAVLGLKLTQTLDRTLNPKSTTYWSDSRNVLFWIHIESRSYKPFASHRIGEIHELSNPSQWRYVPTKSNSSDLATRGISALELSESDLWWHGPDFLLDTPIDWPVDQTFTLKLVRVTAWVKRFIHNCGNKVKHCEPFLTSDEIDSSEIFWFRRAQCDEFAKEISEIRKDKYVSSGSKLSNVNPFMGCDEVLRVGGRLDKANCISYSARHPIILPRQHRVTELVVEYYHEKLNHEFGVSFILSELRSKFWILRARECVKSLKCLECVRRRRKPARQMMAPLPKNRLEPIRAFARTGLDFGGPYLTKQGRGRIQTKRYLCLFTCLSTRAVHLEMAWSLDTDSFLSALDRFVSRRSKPIEIVSDNGSNFIIADRELKKLIAVLDQVRIGNRLSNRGIKWSFNPPLAPHFGGVFDALIISAKRAIRAILGHADISDEELLTAITGAEGLINNRPLCYISDSASDDPVLTPSHFLCGQLGGSLAPDLSDIRYNPRRRWRRVQDLLGQFWRRWLREFLPSLNARSKWNYPSKNLEIDDMVIVIDPQTP